jgi:serine/threonine-protein kinase
LSKAEAADVAGKAGLQIRFDEQYSESVARGVVISTDPGAGTKVRKGSAIEAELSKGPERFPMPTVVGLTQSAAESAIQKASLDVGKVSLKYSDTVGAGIVLSASQSAGSSLKRATAVGLTVSRGPRPIKITNYEGKPAGPAEAALTKAGFTIAEQTANSDTVPKDSVISQDPKSGGGAKGDTITVVRSLGPVPVTVPNVTGMGVRAAQKVMSDAGFKTRVRAVAVNYLGVGFVAYCSPRSRTQAPKGSTITLYVV